MRLRDSKEFYNVKEKQTFEEYKSFEAEEYYSLEIAKSPVELVKIDEIHNEETSRNSENNDTDTNRLDELNKVRGTEQANTTLSSSASASSSGASAPVRRRSVRLPIAPIPSARRSWSRSPACTMAVF